MNSLQRMLMSLALTPAVAIVSAQEVNVSGVVTDATGETIIGASVVEKGTTNGTVTDIDGKFTIKVKKGAQLEFSYIGYNNVTLEAKPTMNVKLSENAKLVEEVVVTGYTTQRKADLTGAVSVVSVTDLQKQNENNPNEGSSRPCSWYEYLG